MAAVDARYHGGDGDNDPPHRPRKVPRTHESGISFNSQFCHILLIKYIFLTS